MSSSETKSLYHIRLVNTLLLHVCINLVDRAINHDDSKLKEPEKSMYDEFLPKFEGWTREDDPDRYDELLNQMGQALKHHYELNTHHPQHFQNGIEDMNFLDIIEMLCDWRAASIEKNRPFREFIDGNAERFGIEPQLYNVFINTAKSMNWLH